MSPLTSHGLHEGYLCPCNVPKPLMVDGEDSGLCFFCSMVYDPDLYERRLRQHVEGFGDGNLHDFLMRVDPRYRMMVNAT